MTTPNATSNRLVSDVAAGATFTQLSRALSMTRLNLGAGGRPILMPGWRNTDYVPGPGIDDVFDLDQPWPYLDGAISEIVACHTLEHVKQPIHFLSEVQRVLAPNGHCLIRVPYGTAETAMADLTHTRPFYLSSFMQCAPNTTSWSFNPQHVADGHPQELVIDDARYVIESRLEWVPFRKWWVPTAERYLRNIVSELWVYLHRLSPEDAAALRRQPVNATIPLSITTEATACGQPPVCNWASRTDLTRKGA